MQRDNAIDISKALAIISMVVFHSGCPSPLGRFIAEYHMPLFFMTAGYFFAPKYADAWPTFVVRRLKGLYRPFVKWSVVFLILHNLFFAVGLMNEQYGNETGGVVHPYTWHAFSQRLWNVVFSMSGFDEFMTGAFWFFRALFVASILYLILYKLCTGLQTRFANAGGNLPENGKSLRTDKLQKAAANPWTAPVAVALIAFGLTAWQTAGGLKMGSIAQGGYRDLMGTFFFAAGYLCRMAVDRYGYRPRLWVTLVCLGVVIAFSVVCPAGMNYRVSFLQFIALPLPAFCGVVMLYNAGRALSRSGRPVLKQVKRALTFCGENTLYILIFHFLCFRLVSLLKIWWYDLDIAEVSSHPVVHSHADDLFWLLYAAVGVVIPLLGRSLWLRLRR